MGCAHSSKVSAAVDVDIQSKTKLHTDITQVSRVPADTDGVAPCDAPNQVVSLEAAAHSLPAGGGPGSDRALEPLQAWAEDAAQPLTVDRDFKGAPIPGGDAERIASVSKLRAAFDASSAQPDLDEIAELLATIFQAPLTQLNFVDGPCEYTRNHGAAKALAPQTLERQLCICAWTLLPPYPEVLVIQDSKMDSRFDNHPLVVSDSASFRFYSGTPLVSSWGVRFGTLCMVDMQPREVDSRSMSLLINFGELVVRDVERKYVIGEEPAPAMTKRVSMQHNPLPEVFDQGVMVCRVVEGRASIHFANDILEATVGLKRDNIKGKDLWDVFKVTGRSKDESQQLFEHAMECHEPVTIHSIILAEGFCEKLTFHFRSATLPSLDVHAPLIAIPAHIQAESLSSAPLDSYFLVSVKLQRRTTADSKSLSTAYNVLEHERSDELELGALIGKSCYGRLYRGTWLNTPVSIKVVEAQWKKDDPLPQGIELPEAKLSMPLAHPNIVNTFQVATKTRKVPSSKARRSSQTSTLQLAMFYSGEGREGGELPPAPQIVGFNIVESWIIREHCDKGCLQDLMDRGFFQRTKGPNPVTNIVPLLTTFREIASGLAYLHALKIVHADLNGYTIRLLGSAIDPRGFIAKIADFELSRHCPGGELRDVKTVGKVSHQPPELLGDALLTRGADVYAFGVLLWEAYTGQRAWVGLVDADIIRDVKLKGLTKHFLNLPSNAPRVLKTLLERCFHKDPKMRPGFLVVIPILKMLEDAHRAAMSQSNSWDELHHVSSSAPSSSQQPGQPQGAAT